MENNTKRKDHLETLHNSMTILAVVALIGFVISMSMALSMMVGG